MHASSINSFKSWLNVIYVEKSNLTHYLTAYANRIVAVVGYGHECGVSQGLFCPAPVLALEQLNQDPMVEVWTNQDKVDYLQDGEHRFSLTDQILFGYMVTPESDGALLENASYSTYQNILKYSSTLGYPHLLRMWNYFPGINKEQKGLERYKRFCMGRYEAFAERSLPIKSTVPAGTAIGTDAGAFTTLFLSSKKPGKHIENLRQISAYAYPDLYGPRSPSFSRASLYTWKAGAHLFLAGTASIVGHESCHPADPGQQARETIRNIQTLVRRVECEETLSSDRYATKRLFKVYTRHPSHLQEIKAQLQKCLGGNDDILFLRGDICRPELLLEVEGIVTYSH